MDTIETQQQQQQQQQHLPPQTTTNKQQHLHVTGKSFFDKHYNQDISTSHTNNLSTTSVTNLTESQFTDPTNNNQGYFYSAGVDYSDHLSQHHHYQHQHLVQNPQHHNQYHTHLHPHEFGHHAHEDVTCSTVANIGQNVSLVDNAYPTAQQQLNWCATPKSSDNYLNLQLKQASAINQSNGSEGNDIMSTHYYNQAATVTVGNFTPLTTSSGCTPQLQNRIYYQTGSSTQSDSDYGIYPSQLYQKNSSPVMFSDDHQQCSQYGYGQYDIQHQQQENIHDKCMHYYYTSNNNHNHIQINQPQHQIHSLNVSQQNFANHYDCHLPATYSYNTDSNNMQHHHQQYSTDTERSSGSRDYHESSRSRAIKHPPPSSSTQRSQEDNNNNTIAGWNRSELPMTSSSASTTQISGLPDDAIKDTNIVEKTTQETASNIKLEKDRSSLLPTPSEAIQQLMESDCNQLTVLRTNTEHDEEKDEETTKKSPDREHFASQRLNQCRVCGRNYARPSTLKTHLRTHTNERPFKCDVCHKTFSQAANLTAHQRVHTGERPFSCPTCGRQFSQSSSVITHLRTHSGERPYRCIMCSRTFSDSSTLTKHCRIHSGEKPYQCDYCPLNFSQSGNLSRHLKLHSISCSGSTSVASSKSNAGSNSDSSTSSGSSKSSSTIGYGGSTSPLAEQSPTSPLE